MNAKAPSSNLYVILRFIIAAIGVFAAVFSFSSVRGARLATFDDLRTETIPAISLSSDGKELAVANFRRTVILRYPSGDLIAELGEGSLPQWAPKGHRLCFYSNRSGNDQIWCWNGGAPRQITSIPGGVSPDAHDAFSDVATDPFHFSWSPDGTKIVFESQVEMSSALVKSGPPLVLDNTTSPALTLAGVCKLPVICPVTYRWNGPAFIAVAADPLRPKIGQLFVADLNTHRVKRITSLDRTFSSPAWSRGGILAVARTSSLDHPDVLSAFTANRSNPDTQIVSIGPKSGKLRVLADDVGCARHLRLSVDDHFLFYSTSRTLLDTATRIEGIDLKTGQQKEVASGALTGDWQVLARAFAVINTRAGKFKLGVLDSADGRIADQNVDGPTIANNWIVDSAGGITWVDPVGQVVYRKSGVDKTIFRLRRSADLVLGKVRVVSWENARGDKLQGSVLLPPFYVPGHRYPLIVDAYPLARSRDWMDPMGANQTWAAAGYVIFMPGPRGPHVWMNSRQNPAMGRAGIGPEGWQVALTDVMSGIERLDREGLIDPNRMCLYGHSNGGGEVAYLVTLTHRFRCAVVVAPAFPDWISRFAIMTGARAQVKMLSGGFDLDRNINDLAQMSSVFSLYKSNTPMLIADGDEDADFLLGSIEVYNAVRAAHVPVTLVRYPGQGHVLVGSAMRDLWRRELAFFKMYLD